MSKPIIVLAPHPDDETLGCGGTLLKHQAAGERVHWLIGTCMSPTAGYSPERIKKRQAEIDQVTKLYGFASVHSLEYPTTQLDQVGKSELIQSIHRIFSEVKPATVYLPFPHDAHSDHLELFEAGLACTKWFRHPYVERVYCYETLSETDFGSPLKTGFVPSTFVDITLHLEKKLQILQAFDGELGKHPFPRSEESVRALATVRGASSGFGAAEALMLIRERYR